AVSRRTVMDEFLDAIPGGRLTLAALALLAVPGVRRQLRPLARAAIRAGLAVTDQVKELIAETREQASDLVAEARAERAGAQDGAGARPARRSRAEAPGGGS